MSATLATIVRPQVTARPGAFSWLFSAGWDGIARYFVRRAAIASLRKLDDRLLRDIGLERSQIEAAVDGFITRSRPSEQAMMASSAAMGPPAEGCRPRASTQRRPTWS
jgi:uncharacterized protein YjiS (DUF1127 family)